MTKVSITEIKQYCKRNGLSIKLQPYKLNNNKAYLVGNKVYTVGQLKEYYIAGELQ